MPEPRDPPFADLELARRLERAEGRAGAHFIEARQRVAPERGACWAEIAGALVLYDGPGSPVTQTFGLGLGEPVAAGHLDEIERFFQERGAAVNHEVSPLAGIELMRLLDQRGYRPVELTSVLYRPIWPELELMAARNDRLRTRVIGGEEQGLWTSLAARGWSHLPELNGFLLEMAETNGARADTVSLIAELDGEPVACAALCIHESTATLAGACTVPEARRQGAQLALLESRLRYAAQRGCDLAMMGAAPGSASQRNAERHGFRIAYTRTKWCRGADSA